MVLTILSTLLILLLEPPRYIYIHICAEYNFQHIQAPLCTLRLHFLVSAGQRSHLVAHASLEACCDLLLDGLTEVARGVQQFHPSWYSLQCKLCSLRDNVMRTENLQRESIRFRGPATCNGCTAPTGGLASRRVADSYFRSVRKRTRLTRWISVLAASDAVHQRSE